jgi:hypothetical protein
MSSQTDVEAELAALKGSSPAAIDAPEAPAAETAAPEEQPESAEKGPQS